MKVAINILPLKSAHRERGIGYYTSHLIEYLKKNNSIKVEEFVKLSEVKSADIIHYPWFDLFFHTLPLKRPFPTVISIHDVIPLIYREHYPVGIRGKINFLLQRIALNTCKAFITDCETSRKDIVSYLKLRAEKVFAIHLAQDENFKILSDNRLLYVKRKFNLPQSFLLYVGDANWVKNLPFLIKAFRKFLKNKSDLNDLKLVLVGGVFLKIVDNIDHPELESLKMVNRLITEYDLDKKILRVGNLQKEELVAFYNLATVYVQPSFYEGFGLPILEAFSCGTPVVCSSGGSLPEVGGDAALYFDPNNEEQFIRLIYEVLQDKSLREKLVKLGLKQAEKFSWQKVAEQTKKVYEKVLEK